MMKTYSRKNSSYLKKAFVGINFDEMCRLCLSEVCLVMKPIFQEMNNISYQERIQYSVDVLVKEGDGLPPNVCEECYLMVEKIYLFKKKCKASDAKLREHLELLELDEEGKFNEMNMDNVTEDKDAFTKEEARENNKSNAIDRGGTEVLDESGESKSNSISKPAPDTVEVPQSQEKVQVKRYILKGEISADDQEEDLTVCEVVPLEDKISTQTLELENRIEEIYKLWDNEEESEKERVSVEDEEEEVVENEEPEVVEDEVLEVVEGVGDKSGDTFENGIVTMQMVYVKKNQPVKMKKIPEKIEYKCFACHKVFEKSAELSEHLSQFHRNVPNPVFCGLCGKSFTCSNSLKRHTSVHTGARPYQCPVCNRRFSQCSILKRHEYTHNALKPFNCELCGKSYTQKLNLLMHLKNHGFGIDKGRFCCTICSKSFVHQSGLSRHSKTHQGIRYLCTKCNRFFRDSSALTRHIKKLHPEFRGTVVENL